MNKNLKIIASVFIFCSAVMFMASCTKKYLIVKCQQPWNSNCLGYDSLWASNSNSVNVSPNPLQVNIPMTIQLNYPEKGELDFEIFSIQGTKVDSGQLQFIPSGQQSSALYTIPNMLMPGPYILVLRHKSVAIISRNFIIL